MDFNEMIAKEPHGDKCPFCPLEKEPNDKKSYIGKDNDSGTLAENLEAAGDTKEANLYFDVEYEIYRKYSAEAHHLICGNEVLKEEGEIERYLIKQSNSSSKGASGYLEPNDVGYDVNHANNGIWLPSVPDMFRESDGKQPNRWWGDQKKWNRKNSNKPPRISLEEWEKCDAAFIVMEKVKRQFHKGQHGHVGKPHENYVTMAISKLKEVTVFVEHYAEICPMEDDGSSRKSPPYWPAYGLIPILDALSRELKKELEGSPESWNYYISEYAKKCSEWWKRELKK